MAIGTGVIEDAIFLTGMQRSGTTLLEKLLAAQPHISMLSQPFPFLFVDAKDELLRTMGIAERYPLGHLFLEDRYDRDALARYLEQWRPARARLEELFRRMESYSGQYTRFSSEELERAFSSLSEDDDFAATVAKLDRALSRAPGARWFGSKETTCEEFLPALLDRGFRCMLILRDPRDIVTSLNHGRGEEFGGTAKPTLFNIRSWRKSVAFALGMEEHPRFQWCRYEDLVADPPAELHGDWRGNSSHHEHRGISAASVGAYRDILPPSVASFIEAACLPELQLLGYETTLNESQAVRVLHHFREPYPIARPGMERDAATPENAALEAQRLAKVSEPAGEDTRLWFLFERVHARLNRR